MSFQVKYRCPECGEYMYTSYLITEEVPLPVLKCEKCGKILPPYCGPTPWIVSEENETKNSK